MAPSIAEVAPTSLPILPGKNTSATPSGLLKEPFKLTGALDHLKHRDLTPCIGREYPEANIVDILEAPNADELILELAVTISRRGVVFFRKQDNLTTDHQKKLVQRLGELTNKPKESGLHIHPVLNDQREFGEPDGQITTISSKQFRDIYKIEASSLSNKKQSNKREWHSDIAFEPMPADYTSLRLTQLPVTGGDTLWASGYEIYDRFSTPYQKFFETLDVTFAQPFFNKAAADSGFQLYDKERGHPANIGSELKAVHPLVRTNPVTGWKSIYAVGQHISHINGLTKDESADMLAWFVRVLQENHDLQVRFNWQNENDIAIWDNRSHFHAATFDVDGFGDRYGTRSVGVGEEPYLDSKSWSRREALEKEGSLL